eukprot:499984_1
MYYPIYNQLRYTMDNCEINNCYYGSYETNPGFISNITDTYIHNVEYINSASGVIYNRCKLQSFNTFAKNIGENVAVRNSDISNATKDCIYIYSNNYALFMFDAIYNNRIDSCQSGIRARDGNYDGVIIRNNYISNCSKCLNIATSGHTYLIEHNNFNDCGYGIDNGGIIIRYNNFTNSQTYSIYSEYNEGIIAYNTFNKNDGNDLYIRGSNKQVYNNKFIDSIDTSILVEWCDNTSITNNQFTNNNNSNGIAQIEIKSTASNVSILNNDFYNHNGQYVIFLDLNSRENHYVQQNNFIANNEIENIIYIKHGGKNL